MFFIHVLGCLLNAAYYSQLYNLYPWTIMGRPNHNDNCTVPWQASKGKVVLVNMYKTTLQFHVYTNHSTCTCLVKTLRIFKPLGLISISSNKMSVSFEGEHHNKEYRGFVTVTLSHYSRDLARLHNVNALKNIKLIYAAECNLNLIPLKL